MTYLNPTESRVKPLEGNGILKARIYFKSILIPDCEAFVERILAYEYLETGSHLLVFLENPRIKNASALDEDIRESLKSELRSQGINLSEYSLKINFYEPK